MAFFFAYDRKSPREEELAASRMPSRQPSMRDSSNPLEAPQLDSEKRSDGSGKNSPSPALQRRNVVFPDPAAFRYIEEDPSVTVALPKGVLYGYELYLVEQWACSRQSPTLVIATYTGDQRHSIVVGVLSVPVDETTWSPRLRVFFKAIQQYHARPKDTSLGELMVTNLSSFPSAFTVIPVPGGDIKKHQKTFMVNEDLKRLGCSGRSGLTLSEPTPTTQAKFYQLYKVSDRIEFSQAVLELVKMCQVALFLFGHLDQEYMDGLLCDVTETAISNWWTEVGAEYYNMEPSDGILGPTTVAALLGTLMGARNRLHSYGAPVSKDVFDIEGTRRGISYFQKYQRLEKTRRLDRQTLLKLQTVTAKAAAGEGWGVPKAVKSTVAEFGGKRGELVMGMVSGKDKGGIGEVETLDIEKFIALASGERAKWLWHGKPRRTGMDHYGQQEMANIYNREETSSLSSKRVQSQPLEEETELRQKESSPGIYSQPPPGSSVSMVDSPGERDGLHKTVFKTVAGRMSDARSGLGRIKGAVGGGRRTHGARTKDEFGPEGGLTSPMTATSSPPPAMGGVPRVFTWKNKPEEYSQGHRKEREGSGQTVQTTPESTDKLTEQNATMPSLDVQNVNAFNSIATEVRRDLVDGAPSVAGSTVDESDLLGPMVTAERNFDAPFQCLHRRHSIESSRLSAKPLDENRWPRRLSFGDAEEAVLTWEDISDPLDPDVLDISDPSIIQRQKHLEELSRSLNEQVTSIKRDIEPWVLSKIAAIETLDGRHARDVEDIAKLAGQLTDAYQRVQTASAELVAEERSSLTEKLNEVEALAARLEYEIDALASRVDDVEDGAAQFEKQVIDLERRAEELRVQLETESWLHWFVRTLTGIGTGPNITRPREVEVKGSS